MNMLRMVTKWQTSALEQYESEEKRTVKERERERRRQTKGNSKLLRTEDRVRTRGGRLIKRENNDKT